MYVGVWNENIAYKRGNIVYDEMYKEHYVCSEDHVSDNLTYPCKDDIYWIHIVEDFVDVVQSLPSHSPIFSDTYKERNRSTTSLLRLPSYDKPKKRDSLKRKLETVENDLENFKKKKSNNLCDLREQLLLLNIDMKTKSFLMDKYETAQHQSGSEYSKSVNWLKTAASIPHGRVKAMKVKLGDAPEKIKEFFDNVKCKLDKSIYGMDDVKQEILEFVARKITNPQGKGDVLALCGVPGVGKTKIIKSLAEALDLPFFQINCGGLNDVSVLTGHSETYVGSKPGKIVELFQNTQYMNPIIYLDEIDKISDRKSSDINGVLTHLLDEEQNNKFQDNYLSNVHLNLSKVFFVLAFNDVSKVDEIVSDRMKIIYIDKPSLEEKVKICQEKLVPDVMQTINFDTKCCINISKEVVEYLVLKKSEKEAGVRQLKKTLEKILNRLNYDMLINRVPQNMVESMNTECTIYNVTKTYIDDIVKEHKEDQTYLSMYS
jgi:ATP-dependent Lon protease